MAEKSHHEIKIANILLLATFDHPFKYRANIENSNKSVNIGDLVSVKFRGKLCYGICESINLEPISDGKISSIPLEKINYISEVKIQNLASNHYINSIKAISKYNMAPIGSFLHIGIPNNIVDHTKSIDKYLSPSYNALGIIESLNTKDATAMKRILDLFSTSEVSVLSKKELVHFHKCTIHHINKAIKLTILEYVEQDDLYSYSKYINYEKAALNEEQESVVNMISRNTENFAVHLLMGITGSGKTEVYSSVLSKILNSNPNAQVLIILPEISLTIGLVQYIEKRFCTKVVIWHSSVSKKDKRDNIKNIVKGSAKIIIGARSAMLLPYKNLRCIVIDEEHDQSLKQDESPVYNARDMSILRAKIEDFPVILSSATPSLESYYNATIGKYYLSTITSRFGSGKIPKIDIIDLRLHKLTKKTFISNPARDKILETINKGDQVLVFINRRGYARLLICKNCGSSFNCINCDNKLSYHKSNNTLQCHYCGYVIGATSQCKKCGEIDCLDDHGPGIERIAEEISGFVTDKSRIMTVSSDTITSKDSIEDHIRKIDSGEVNIIIGTQMMAKGHNFSKLNLVVIVDIDVGLMSGDFRLMERLYQLLVQVSGRSGRSSSNGQVLIQTYRPENPVILSIIKNDHNAFYDIEMKSRAEAKLPPFTKQIAIIVASVDMLLAKKSVQLISKNIGEIFSSQIKYRSTVKVLGPVENVIHYMKRKYRYHIMLQGKSITDLQDIVRNAILNIKKSGDLHLKIDVNPNFIV